MPELRIDPIVGRRVYVAEDRAGRPSDYGPSTGNRASVEVTFSARGMQAGRAKPASAVSPFVKPNCPFCVGNEAQTPVASATAVDADGQWRIRVVPNKYPAAELVEPHTGAFGAHEVIIESPDHLLDVTELGPQRLAEAVRVYRDRLQHWSAQPKLRHGLIFKNSGCDAGASLEHIHSQVTAVPYVLPTVQEELDAAARIHAARGCCAFCDLIEREASIAERLVFCRDGYVAVCPIAPRQPYETWLLAKRHQSRFDQLADDEVARLADALCEALNRLQAVEPGCPYNLLLHTAPFDDRYAASYHWHWEIVPRLTHDAGLEWGGGVFVCPLSPERAATRLRETVW